ncbi:MAG: peptidylprolyl isomerase [Planctomycetaceae bacterium]
MRWPVTGALLVCFLVGCQNKKIVDANPVLGPPPPRTSLENGATARANNSELVQVSGEVGQNTRLIDELDERVVARVGGEPVFAADVLRPFRPFIETQKAAILEQAPVDQRAMALQQMDGEVKTLLDRALSDYLDREVVLQSIDRTLKQEQIDGIQEQIDILFDERVDAIVRASGMSSKAELEDLMQRPRDPAFEKMALAWREGMGTAPGTSLSEARDAFAKMAMAAEFLRARAKEPANIDRSTLLAHYEEHATEYDIPLEIKWQQIVIDRGFDEEEAIEKMQKALRRLRNGEDFGAIAKEISSGPTADDNGIRDWMEAGSLVDSEIESTLFEMKPGDVSDVFKRDDRYELVRVVERRGGFRKSFAKMQSEIRQKLLTDMQADARRDALEKLRNESDVIVLWKNEKGDSL